MKKLIIVVLAMLTITVAASSKATSQPMNPYWTSICCTSIGNCPTPQVAVNGTPCWCPTTSGPIAGNAC